MKTRRADSVICAGSPPYPHRKKLPWRAIEIDLGLRHPAPDARISASGESSNPHGAATNPQSMSLGTRPFCTVHVSSWAGSPFPSTCFLYSSGVSTGTSSSFGSSGPLQIGWSFFSEWAAFWSSVAAHQPSPEPILVWRWTSPPTIPTMITGFENPSGIRSFGFLWSWKSPCAYRRSQSTTTTSKSAATLSLSISRLTGTTFAKCLARNCPNRCSRSVPRLHARRILSFRASPSASLSLADCAEPETRRSARRRATRCMAPSVSRGRLLGLLDGDPEHLGGVRHDLDDPLGQGRLH